jgi:thiol-disulfide isomerase/thioredoxin
MANNSTVAQAPETSTPPPEKASTKRWKLLFGAMMAVGLVAGLYLANRFWIAPLAVTGAKASAEHPLAPDFSLTDISGQGFSLADYKGKVVLLDFWATWCGPCRIEIPGFVQLQDRYRDQGLVVVGVSMDDGPEPVREFYKEFRMNYTVAMGNDTVGELFGGIIGLPTTLLIGRDGRIYAKHSGAMPISVFEQEVQELLAGEGAKELSEFKQVGRVSSQEKIEVSSPEEVNSEVPGVNLSKLSAKQKDQFKKVLAEEPCTCGCKLNLLKCRLDDRSCAVSRRLAREQLDKFLKMPI